MSGYRYFIIVGALSALICLFFYSSLSQQNEIKNQESGAAEVSRLLDLASAAFEQMSERLATELTRVIEAELISNTSTSWLENSSFEALALAKNNGAGGWSVEWVKKRSGVGKEFNFTNWVTRFRSQGLQENQLIFENVAEASGQAQVIFGVQLRVKSDTGNSERLGLGIIPNSEISNLLSSLKTNAMELFFVDSNGYALSYTDPRYIGSKMDVHPLVAVALKASSLRSIGPFSDLAQRETIGGYKKSLKTGVFTIVNVPAVSSVGQKQGTVFSFVLSLAATILALVLIAVFVSSDNRRLRLLRDQLAKLQSQNKSLQSESRSLDLARQAHQQWSRSVSGYLRSPVYSLLGEFQKVKDANPAHKKSYEFIESELRKVRDFIEGLSQRSDTADNKQTFNLRDKLEQVFFQQKENFTTRGLRLTTGESPDLFIYGSIADLQAATDLLLEFFRKEMQLEKTDKNLVVNLKPVHGAAELSFECTLNNVPDSLDEMMSLQDERYLNLAVANGLFKSLSAMTSLENGIEKLRFAVKFPLAAQPKKEEPVEVAPAEPSPAESSASKKLSDKVESDLLAKQVTAQLDKMLPPSPDESENLDVSVVNELTATEAETPPKVSIRKPRVRYDS